MGADARLSAGCQGAPGLHLPDARDLLERLQDRVPRGSRPTHVAERDIEEYVQANRVAAAGAGSASRVSGTASLCCDGTAVGRQDRNPDIFASKDDAYLILAAVQAAVTRGQYQESRGSIDRPT